MSLSTGLFFAIHRETFARCLLAQDTSACSVNFAT